MAIDSILVTKASVSRIGEKKYSIILNMTCQDSGNDVLVKNYTIQYWKGRDVPTTLDKTLSIMQRDIDIYKETKALSDTVVLNDAIDSLQTQLISANMS